MSLKSRVAKLEKDERKDFQPVLCCHSKEEYERKVKDYWDENPDGPTPIIINTIWPKKKPRNQKHQQVKGADT